MLERRADVQARHQGRLLIPLLVAWAAGAAGLTALGVQRSVPLEHLFLDPATVAGAPWYAGAVSQLGIVCWTVAAVASAGGAWVAGQTGRPSAARFLAIGSAVTTVMLADDLLQLHSDVLPRLLGLPKTAAMGLVVGPVILWAIRWYREVVRTRWPMLVGALGGWATSVMVDRVVQPDEATGLLVEDGAKFLGVLAWAIYFATTAIDITRSTIRSATESSTPPDAKLEPWTTPRPGAEEHATRDSQLSAS